MFRKLFRYILPYRWQALAAVLLMASEVMTELLQPAMMARIIDRGVGNGDVPFILRQGGFMLLIAILGIIGGVGCSYFAGKAGYGYAADLRLALFSRIQRFAFRDVDRFSTASLITRLTNDVVQIQNIVLMLLRIMVRAPLMGLGGLIMAFVLNARLAVILVFIIPVLAVTVTWIIRKSFPLYGLVQSKIDRVNTVMRENLAGIRVVKAFAREGHETGRFETASGELCGASVRAGRIVNLTHPLMTLVMNIGLIAVIWFGGIGVHLGQTSTGTVMAMINYMTQILFSLMILSHLFVSLSRGRVSAARVVEVLETEPEAGSAPERPADNPQAPRAPQAPRDRTAAGCRVEFECVSFRYGESDGMNVLENLRFRLMPGEYVAMIGATGSGKTSLVNLIPRFYDVTGGAVLVDGTDVREWPLEQLRRRIGMVLQDSVLFTGTIRDNLLWGNTSREVSREEIEHAARIAQAHESVMSFPKGYDTLLGQRGVNLSGGQKQRLCIARALLAEPGLLIMDDSLSAVDVLTGSQVRKAIRREGGRMTCLVIAQRISTVMEADWIIVLDEGRMADMGRHDELMDRCGLYRDIYESQLGGREDAS